MVHLAPSRYVPSSTSAAARRQLCSSLRLFLRPLVVLLSLLFALTVVATAELGQEYAHRQQQIAFQARVFTCEELLQAGSSTNCERAQELQNQSRIGLLELADEVGPPALSSRQPLGALSFVLGHATTTVGLMYIILVAAVVFGAEKQSGLAQVRDTYMGHAISLWSRAISLMLVWLMGICLAAVAMLMYNMWATTTRRIAGSPDYRATLNFFSYRLMATIAVVVMVALAITVITTRAERAVLSMATGAFLAGALLLTNRVWFLPIQAAWTLMRFWESESYFDHLPLFAASTTENMTPIAAITILYTIAVVVSVMLWTRKSDRRPKSA